jgi:hypothetical protein
VITVNQEIRHIAQFSLWAEDANEILQSVLLRIPSRLRDDGWLPVVQPPLLGGFEPPVSLQQLLPNCRFMHGHLVCAVRRSAMATAPTVRAPRG